MDKQIDLIWKKIIGDLEGEDVVLEIKLFYTNLEIYNKLLKFLAESNYDFTYNFKAIKEELPTTVDSDFFETDYIKEVRINLTEKLNIICGFNEKESIEFFTNSVLNLKSKEIAPLLNFIVRIGKYLKSNVYLYVEQYPKPSSFYDYSSNSWFVSV